MQTSKVLNLVAARVTSKKLHLADVRKKSAGPFLLTEYRTESYVKNDTNVRGTPENIDYLLETP